MRKVVLVGLVAGLVGILGQYGGAYEHRAGASARDASAEDRIFQIAVAALARAEVSGCDEMRVIEADSFLKRIGVICGDGRSHWISHEAALMVDGLAV